ncbi:MAG: DUF4368 domain-containing protein, partial [Clostridiales bacterium]|nr:DUF4368 domain-containing protein [Clostridiales bacterium]
EANFNLMMKKAQDEQAELTDRVKHNKELLSDQNKLTRDNQQWLDMIREYADIQALDAETLQKLIREITVHEDIDEDGTRNITAEIHFNLKPLPEPMGGSEPTTE